MAKKYPYIQDGYDGAATGAVKYFTKRLREIRNQTASRPNAAELRISVADKYHLSGPEIKSLNLARKIAEFMDERKEWMMKTRRQMKKPLIDIKHGWFYKGGEIELLDRPTTESLWQSLVDFRDVTGDISGIVACDGGKYLISGECVVMERPDVACPKRKIIIVPFTSPDYVPLMKQARAIVTDHGGMMSHAAIVARELNLPCVVGTKNATKTLKNGDKITIDLLTGKINIEL
jgi:phosphohistidine swiveling domain-containing protein